MLDKIISAEFVTSVFSSHNLPVSDLPEIAFAGRSNVGKSSLLNRLLNRKALVKVSSRPGFTQSLNFFCVNQAVHFVDLPGYGFARAPKKVKYQWYALVEGYLKERKQLKCVVCILDMRRMPDRLDLDMLDFLKAFSIPALVVLNKADKISQPKRKRQLNAITGMLTLSAQYAPVIVSARTGEGVQKLRNLLGDMLLEVETGE
jgi:GTP-binding protein